MHSCIMEQTSTHVVIAGGTGFIGRRLAALLAADGRRVVVLTRRNNMSAVGNVEFVQWDGAQSGDWCNELADASAIVNLCGESIAGKRWSENRKQQLLDSRVKSTSALVQACNDSKSPPRVFVQASGVGYYGTGNKEFTESNGAGTDFLANLAQAWEKPLAKLAIRTVTTRLGVVLGRTGGALPQMLLPFRAFAGGPIAGGNQWLSWIHLHDAVMAMVHLIELPHASGPFNLVAPRPVRNHEFAQAAARALHRPDWLPTPRFLMKALLGEQATLVCDGQQVQPAALRQVSFEFRFPSLEAALGDLTN
ncbi:MAG: TIGR01777 family oxidoreductase [Pseudomonadales bacterium]